MPTTALSRIEAARTSRGISREKLAVDAGLSFSMIMKIERGEREPSLGALRRIASAIGVPVTDLLDTGDDAA